MSSPGERNGPLEWSQPPAYHREFAGRLVAVSPFSREYAEFDGDRCSSTWIYRYDIHTLYSPAGAHDPAYVQDPQSVLQEYIPVEDFEQMMLLTEDIAHFLASIPSINGIPRGLLEHDPLFSQQSLETDRMFASTISVEFTVEV